MKKPILLFGLMLATTPAAAQTPTFSNPEWTDVIKTCSAEYRERADKTRGREVWQKFLADCKDRKGYVSKRQQKAAPVNFVRVPDKQ